MTALGMQRSAIIGVLAGLLSLAVLVPAQAEEALRPSAPTDISAVNRLASTELDWAPPLNDGGSPILMYTVYRSMNGGQYQRIADLSGYELSFTDPTATSISLSYLVTASNEIGEGPPAEMTVRKPVFRCGIVSINPSGVVLNPSCVTYT